MGLDRPRALQAVEATRLLRKSAHEGGKVISPTHLPSLPPRNNHFCYRLIRPEGHSAAGRTKSMKNLREPIGNRSCDLPVCSTVAQPTALSCTPSPSYQNVYNLSLPMSANTICAALAAKWENFTYFFV
jgi:hypothetical protein